MNKFSIKYALSAIRVDPIRTALTLIGIIIGVATAVLIIGIGQGVIGSVDATLNNFGSNVMVVVPSAKPLESGLTNLGRLDKEDIKSLEAFPFLKHVAYMGLSRVAVYYDNYFIRATVYGANDEIFSLYNKYYQIEHGRFFKDNDGRVAVLGWEAANKLFPKKILVGKHILINNKTYRVIGIVKKVGTSFSQSDDQAIIIPYKTAKKDLYDNKDEIEMLMASVNGVNMTYASQRVSAEICKNHHVNCDNKDFSIITQEYMKKMVNDILFAVYAGALAVGLIASIVSGIGIANTMYTSVFRRKRELGLLKALGANNGLVLKVIMIESILLGIIGAMLGFLFGVVIGYLIKPIVPFTFSPVEVLAAFIIGVVMGVIGGYLPAKRAVSISPLEAISY